MRMFAALPVPDEAAERLQSLQRGLPGRLTRPENLHLTLAFFGETSETAADDIHSALSAIRARGFEWWLDGVGVFGGDRPTLIHAAVRPEPALTLLHEKVAQAGRSAGAAVEAGRYTPHVTLSRLARGAVTAHQAAKALAARAMFLHGPIAAGRFALCRSHLGRDGPIYEEIASYPLG
ncbi:MAG: RNA 2',3'-cyclic phosphodiesterase [Rubrimonas sp.]